MFLLMQAIVLLSLIGSLRDYKRHGKTGPVVLAIASAAAIIYGINANLDTYFIFPGIVGMLIVSTWTSIELKRSLASDGERSSE